MPAGGTAAHLGVDEYHLNALTHGTRWIDLARTTGPELALTRASAEAEKHWRDTATVGQKAWRLVKDLLKAL
ncbi:hypothetical protein ACF9IK_36900 [Kitasatospora hibisci]|uniref:hypothetical protein n=1 Tax=Kitasatospora hibisci TaxID=3369522 RepID=UPI0037542FC3